MSEQNIHAFARMLVGNRKRIAFWFGVTFFFIACAFQSAEAGGFDPDPETIATAETATDKDASQYIVLGDLLKKLEQCGGDVVMQGQMDGDSVSVSSPEEFIRDGDHIIITGAIASKLGHIGKITVSGWFGTRRAKLYIGRSDEENINGKWMVRVPSKEMWDNVTVKVAW